MILFFVRRFNDIDHMVPVIYKCAESKIHELMVLSLDPGYDIWDDPGINYLRDKLGIRVDYVYNIYRPTAVHRILSFLMCGPYSFNNWRKRWIALRKKVNYSNLRDLLMQIFIDSLRRIFYKRFYEKAKAKYFNAEWAEEVLKQLGAVLLVFDWVKYYQNITASFLSAARQLGITTVSLPCGVPVFSWESWREEDLVVIGKTYLFDYLVSPNKVSREVFIKSGIPLEKIYTLGSARFCPEWMKIYPDIYSDQKFISSSQNKKVLKVVYMEGGTMFLQDKNELIRTIQKISGLDFVNFVIKPKSRSNKLQIPELEPFGEVARDTSSYVLCKWADAVIVPSSSIYLEVLGQNKALIYPKFLLEKTMVFEEMDVGWIVNSCDELVDALRKLKGNPLYRPYSDEAVNRLFTEVINDGVKDRDVLAEYKEFIFGKALKI